MTSRPHDRATISGRDVVDELIGVHSFVEASILRITGRLPTGPEATMVDAIMVTLIEHGLTPSAVAARLTYLGAPESLSGAVAAGLAGVGSRFLGTPQEVAELLQTWYEPQSDATRVAQELVASLRNQGRIVPGFGHPIHREHDPRVDALFDLQRSLGLPDDHARLMEQVGVALREQTGRTLPMNAAGAIGAIVSDLDQEPAFARGIALIARCAGLVGHIADERHEPVGPRLWQAAREIEAGNVDTRSAGPPDDDPQ